MAAYTATFVKTATVAASVVDTFSITKNVQAIEIVHHGNVSNPLYVIIDDATATPTVAGDNCEIVLAGERCRFSPAGASASSTVVSVISAGTPTITVVGVK